MAAKKQRIISAANSKRWTDHEPLVWVPTIDTTALEDEPTTGTLEDSSSLDDLRAKEEELAMESSRDMSIQSNNQSAATQSSVSAQFHTRTDSTKPGKVTTPISLYHHEPIAERHPPHVSERVPRSRDIRLVRVRVPPV